MASFGESVIAGVKGMVKGAIGLGVVGALAGAAISGVMAIVSAQTLFAAGAAMLGGAGMGSLMGIAIGAPLGSLVGAIQSREPKTPAPSAEEIANLAKISFAQGVSIGHQMGHAEQAEPETEKFQKMLAAERAKPELVTVPGKFC